MSIVSVNVSVNAGSIISVSVIVSVTEISLPGLRARIVRCGVSYDPQLVKRSS